MKPSEPKSRLRPKTDDQEEQYYVASQWKLMWRKLRKHKLAMVSSVVLLLLYLIAVFCEFTAPYGRSQRFISYVFAPPQSVHIFSDQGFHLQPFVYGMTRTIDPDTLQKIYTEDRSVRYPIRLFVRGEKYKLGKLSKKKD